MNFIGKLKIEYFSNNLQFIITKRFDFFLNFHFFKIHVYAWS